MIDTREERKKQRSYYPHVIHRIVHAIPAYYRPIEIRIARVATGDGLLIEQVLSDSDVINSGHIIYL